MDTTKQNILMCEKAVEIQKLLVPNRGDVVFVDFSKSGWNNVSCVEIVEEYTCDYDENDKEVITWGLPYPEKGNDDRNIGKKYIWLPRQDQLQEMLRIDGTMLLTQVKDKYAMECWINKNEYSFERDSFEQLWLAFVMKEKYNKEWNGKDWQISE